MNRYLRLLYSAVITWLVVAVLGGAAGSLVHLEPLPAVHWERVLSIAEIVVEESSRAGIGAHLPLALGWRESRLTNAFSDHGDMGPLQVNGLTALHAGFDITALLDPRKSTAVGIGWLIDYQRRCGSDKAAVWAYAKGRCPERKR